MRSRLVTWLLAASACLVALNVQPAAQSGNPAAFWQRQMGGFQRAVSDPSINQRVYTIWTQLVRASGQMYEVRPAQQNTLGQALPNGVILLDLSVAGDDEEAVTAFWLAHEWGHQVMGHPQLMITRLGQFIAASGGTAAEDAADRWAARFLRTSRYDVEPVLDFLCDLPGGGYGDSHSTGPQRARNVATAYGDATSPCGGGRRYDERSSIPQPAPAEGRVCYTNIGACPLVTPYPIGGPCTCFTALGPVPGRVAN